MRTIIGNKQILVYGAGNQGRGIIQALSDQGFEPSGFIDKNPELQSRVLAGLPVHSPEYIMGQDASDTFFVVVASFFFEREIAEELEAQGFIKGNGYISYNALKPHDYVVEVSGVCNLRCISCPRAGSNSVERPPVMMSLANFRQVLAKIRREDPFVGNIQIYQWGEPTLNRDLPAMIHQARENGILCGVSSNLNHPADFRALIEARPECFRISASGTDDLYELTHTGGNWKAFVANVETIAGLRREIYPEMKVELYYHRYKHSIGKPQDQVAELCHKLGFEFHPVPAYLISLDDVLAYCEGMSLPGPAQRVRELLLVDLDEGLERARQEALLECDAFRVLMINADLSVSICMMFYNPEGNTVADNYLETPLEKIIAERTKAPLCVRCRKFGIHRYCGVYAKISEEERY
ncbi:radical SAM protein [Patescibacteria group bacterium]|nr:radical SAM protein [Patescibacteria group bacterium]